MLHILLSGCGGAMGKAVCETVRKQPDFRISAGIDPEMPLGMEFPVFPTPQCCCGSGDVLIDFSHPAALDGLLALCQKRSMPVVIATTGFSHEQIMQIENASKTIPIFFTANMSIGISLMTELARKAAAILSDFDIEIIEKHHNRKIDAPSGTALMLANEIEDSLHRCYGNGYGSHKSYDLRKIEIHSVRGGTIVGEHEILFAGHDELFTLTHQALSREIYAVGALRAAQFLVYQKNGLYSMKHLLNEL